MRRILIATPLLAFVAVACTGTSSYKDQTEDFLNDEEGHDWSASTAKAAASNLLAVARALQANPVPPPPS